MDKLINQIYDLIIKEYPEVKEEKKERVLPGIRSGWYNVYRVRNKIYSGLELGGCNRTKESARDVGSKDLSKIAIVYISQTEPETH